LAGHHKYAGEAFERKPGFMATSPKLIVPKFKLICECTRTSVSKNLDPDSKIIQDENQANH
jgi:hypothetical protein